ncbi:MAG: SDR family NAD(P)-dependent oxidoreductase, partial [Flavipsychrobacter sp.]
MNYYFITGTSRGIGNALVNCLQEDSKNYVTGISRASLPDRAGYHHVSLDLTDIAAVADFKFATLKNAKKIVLINNAGAISEIKPLGRLDNNHLVRDFHVNLVAPAVLMNNFIKAYTSYDAEKIVVNISSGAGKNPVDGWSTYCASKAGLDMLTRVADKEAG